MASRIGAIGRGYIARKFIARELRRRYFMNVVDPAALNIQRVYRGYMVRRRVEATSDRIEAAITLQQMWRRRSNIKKIKDKLLGFRESIRHASASRIQRGYQCYRARQRLLYLRLARQGTCGKASVVIQSAWRSHCSRKALKQFRFCSMIERKADALTTAKNEREMIEFDLFDARADLKRIIRYKAKSLRRIKELKAMRIEWERRQPVVEKELSQLTEEGIDRGWGEAFVTEKHILHYSLELSVEDILSRREQVREYESEIEDLRLEIEDLERDLEECILSETEELEAYREFEMSHAARMFQEERDRRVRLQRIRWRVKNVRTNVILLERADIGSIEKQFLSNRPVNELGALAFEKKQLIEQKLQQAITGAVDLRTKQTAEAIEMRRDAVVLDGFNSAIQRMGDITKEYSFHYRVPKVDLREDPNTIMCHECGRITCDCEAQRAESDASAVKTSVNDQQQGYVAKSRMRNRLARRWRYQDG